MTSTDRNRNDLVPAQKSLEWVAPKISLMKTAENESKQATFNVENTNYCGNFFYPGGFGCKAVAKFDFGS
jgi:hypothetical protein